MRRIVMLALHLHAVYRGGITFRIPCGIWNERPLSELAIVPFGSATAAPFEWRFERG